MKILQRILPGVGLLTMVAVLAGCGTGPKFDARAKTAVLRTVAGEPVKSEADSSLLQVSTNFFTIGPGDVLDLEILGNTRSHTTVSVGPDGKVYFQFLPGLDIWGLTLAQAKALLERELGKYISGSPQVSVSLRGVASKHVWILGRVNKPGVYPITGPMTLLEAISLAGGSARSGTPGSTAEEADWRHSFVQRNGQILAVDFQKLLQEGDMSQNIYLQPDDFIYLPSTLFHEVFVLGAVAAPRTVAYSDHLTLVSAIMAAYGTVDGAYLSHVAIVRGSLVEPRVAVVDYKAIVTGKEPDIHLEPHDIVYVPMHPLSGLKSYAKIILSTFVNTVAANEGANAVVQNPNKVGIAITPGQ